MRQLKGSIGGQGCVLHPCLFHLSSDWIEHIQLVHIERLDQLLDGHALLLVDVLKSGQRDRDRQESAGRPMDPAPHCLRLRLPSALLAFKSH